MAGCIRWGLPVGGCPILTGCSPNLPMINGLRRALPAQDEERDVLVESAFVPHALPQSRSLNMTAEKRRGCLTRRGSEASAIQGPEAAI